MLIYSLADRLGKTAAEIMEIPAEELQGWIAYLSHLNRVSKVGGK